MTIPTLGTLTEACLRDAWDHEAHSFPPWLAQNLDALADVVGIPLELEGAEVAVDTYAADILARNALNDDLVLIENQLEGTDHSHLGQVMTYLAGLDAKIVIWIAAEFRDAQLSAVHWLNEHTVDPFAFFAVKVKVVRIGNSPLAPVFEIVARPNRWERQLQVVAQESRTLSEIGQFRKEFWTRYLDRHPEELADGPAGGYSNRWRTVPEANLIVSYFVSKKSVGLFIRGQRGAQDEEVYVALKPHSDYLMSRTTAEFEAGGGYFFVLDHPTDMTDRTQWDTAADWLHDKLGLYTQALQELESDHAA